MSPEATPSSAEIDAAPFPFEASPAFPTSILDGEAQRAKSHGKRIGILIVTYNALTTLTKF